MLSADTEGVNVAMVQSIGRTSPQGERILLARWPIASAAAVIHIPHWVNAQKGHR